ncbi:putative beta-lysine N-acetyltransferase [Evansella caseinilytica]|uniref:Putative beta-lysine N-acetyltransferase n=1 Tax=Evansella caseinilytica TaxID=1503961 RepID=A0A1H3NMI4_9BACI|nr:putative beta-lysine N-acetyltransferase [Evansella caseinilytica]SDY89963.1 putative beta-lysine N-acetyltransferase [Evansella caseinilytica]
MKNKWDNDRENDRIVAYLPVINEVEITRIEEMADSYSSDARGKIVVYTREEGVEKLRACAFHLEAELSGFFHGEKACILTKYASECRWQSKTAKQNQEVLSLVLRDQKTLPVEPGVHQIELLSNEDAEELALLYRKVFPVYPTNIFSSDLLLQAKNADYVFAVVKDNGKIIGAASAMDSGYGSAEITDCAVQPDYRGRNLLNYLIHFLEAELKKRGVYYTYSMTRSTSVGMNMTVKRLGYRYEGTLTNNCVISTGFEDMNVWSKSLK